VIASTSPNAYPSHVDNEIHYRRGRVDAAARSLGGGAIGGSECLIGDVGLTLTGLQGLERGLPILLRSA
jgi:hypothetical protein